MKLSRLFYFASLLMLIFAASALADVKVKARQTMSGQTYETTTYIKGKRQRTERDMGQIKMVDLTQCDLKRSVQMNPTGKTYILNLFEQSQSAIQNPQSKIGNDGVVRAGGTITSIITYKDTGETKKMFGYNARHIITTMETVSSPDACSPSNTKMEFDGWYIDAAFVLDCQNAMTAGGYNSYQKPGCQDKYQMKTVGNSKRGYPVYEKMTMFDESGKEMSSIVTEVVELSQATLDQALFEIPEDYREVEDLSQMYAATSMTTNSTSTSMNNSSMTTNGTTNSGAISAIQNQTQSNTSTELGAKQPGTIRIGLANVKVGAVGDGIASADLASAVQNTLGEYLKGTKIELVPLGAKLSSAIENEAKEKDCDYILYANVSHKKGGGGFGGMFGQAISQSVGRVGIGQTGSRVGNAIGQVATQTIVSAGAMSANVKSKDEITLDVKMNQPGNAAAVLTKQAKAKAKSDGEDILTPVVEQVAQAVFNAVGK
ncbi:hypothetical protein BH20ACI4_BH20ACI4_21500 [soil metagenome]